MKKLFTIIAIAFVLLGNATKANAQYHVIVADPNIAYDHCRENVLRGDEELRRGAYNTAQFYYNLALGNNRDCPHRQYMSDAEISHRIDECQFASRHNGMTRRQYEEEQDRKAHAAIVRAITNSTNINRQSPAQAVPTNTSTTTELQHYNNNGVSYDANTGYAKVTRVERTTGATIVHFEYLELRSDANIHINPLTYLKDKSTGKKLFLEDSNGIYTANYLKVEAGDSHDFTLTFPAVSPDCHAIDVVEPGENGWKFYHISI